MTWSLRRIVKSLTPRALARWRFVLWQLHPVERKALLGWVMAQRTGQAGDWRRAVAAARTVTFVCHGNIIRSPLAAAAFAGATRGVNGGLVVRSSGVAARIGEPVDARALTSAAERGFHLEGHRSRAFDDAEARESDVIMVMDLPNVGRVLGNWPNAAGRVFLLGGLEPSGRTQFREIYDPVVGTIDDVRRAHDDVLRSVAVAATAVGRA